MSMANPTNQTVIAVILVMIQSIVKSQDTYLISFESLLVMVNTLECVGIPAR